MKTLETLGEYIYIYIYISIFLPKRNTIWDRLLNETVKAYLACVNFNFLNINNEMEKLFA